MIQGLNITVTLQHLVQGGDDEIGGAVTNPITYRTNVKARISSLKPDETSRIQGLETSKLFNAILWPANIPVRENDYILPESGDLMNLTFKILGVQRDSLPSTDPRSHISLRLQRIEKARSLQ